MRIGNREFDVQNRTYIMGILNVTPDSFSDGGRYEKTDAALFHAEQMIKDGADLIDIGGESTRPGYTMVLAREEAERILPVIRAVKERFDIPVSVDTCKASVAKSAVREGADLVNDIWGLKYDQKMAGIIAKADVACCLMHNRNNAQYVNFFEDLKADLGESVKLAKRAGIDDDKIILDPGVGFAKSYEQNLEAIRRLSELSSLGFPVLLGTSRKSVIGLTLDLPVSERVEGTIATTVMAVERGCAFVRVHDVKENIRAVRMTEQILKERKSDGF